MTKRLMKTLALLALAASAHADPTVYGGLGVTVKRGLTAGMDITLVYPQSNFAYEVGGTLIAPAAGDDHSQLALHVAYVRRFGRWDFGLGPAYLNSIDAYNGSHVNMKLVAGYRFDCWTVRWLHFSNGGSSDVNKGRDIVLVQRVF